MSKAGNITGKEELKRMLERIKLENHALRRLIDSLKEQNKAIDREILNKSNK